MSGLRDPDVPGDAGAIWRRAVPVWLALLILLGVTAGMAHVPLGPFNLVLALGIAVAKIALVAIFFMHLRRPDPLLRLAACAAILWILFLFALSFADLLTRSPLDQPGTVEPHTGLLPPQTTGERAF